MPVREIVLWPDSRLSRPCATVAEGEDVSALIADLFETMYNAPGRGLAAPQLGVMKRVFVMDAGWKEGQRRPMACINPVIADRADELVEMREACLSIPGISALIERPAWVLMRWTDEHGQHREERLEGTAAVVAQHEFDHTEGRVIFDHLPPGTRAVLEAHYEDGA